MTPSSWTRPGACRCDSLLQLRGGVAGFLYRPIIFLFTRILHCPRSCLVIPFDITVSADTCSMLGTHAEPWHEALG